jgi:hypothetical protein
VFKHKQQEIGLNHMVIKNKDGSVFQVSKPNPLMDLQEWNNLILYNCQWKGHIVQDVKPKKPLPKIVEKPIEIPLVDTLTTEEPTYDDHVETKSKLENVSESLIPKIVRIHCLPANIITEKDNLYDEVRHRVEYGQKFAFEALVVEKEDLNIAFWTNQSLSKASIVYPSVYRKGNIKYGDYRWWKIESIEEKSGGYLVKAVASEIQPDFS